MQAVCFWFHCIIVNEIEKDIYDLQETFLLRPLEKNFNSSSEHIIYLPVYSLPEPSYRPPRASKKAAVSGEAPMGSKSSKYIITNSK